MDSPASALSRAGRTFWTVWNYFTEVVERYLRPEPTNIGTNDTSSRQEATAVQQTDDHRDVVKNESKATEVTFETDSEVNKPRPVVAWEQCNVIIGPGLSRENVQYTGQSNRGSDSKQEQEDQTENKEELNMGKGVQSVVFTGIQLLLREPTSERSKGQGAQGHTESYNCAEANRLRDTAAARKEEGEIPEEVTEEGTKTEEHENNGDGEVHSDIDPNLPSACAEPDTLLDNNGNKGSQNRLMIHHEVETMVRFNEEDGEEETAVLFMETDQHGWQVSEKGGSSVEGENTDDLCVIKDKTSRDGNEVKNGIDMEELRMKEDGGEEMDRREQEEILDRREQEEMDRREQEEILDRGEQEEILDRGEQEEILDRGEQEEILDRGEQEEILDRGEQEEILDRGEQEEILDRGEQEEILDRREQEEILDRREQEEILDRREQEEILDRREQEEILDRGEQEEILDRGEQEEILDRGEQEEILDRGEQEEILDRGEQEEILDRGEQEEILDRREQEEILDRREQEEILDRGEQEEILDRGEQEEILDRREQEEILDRREQEEILDRGEQEEILDRGEQEEILDRGEQEAILDRGEQEEILDRGEQEEILDRGEQEEILDRGEQEEILDRGEQEEILDRGEQEEILDRGEQEEILDRGEQEEILDRGEQEEILDRREQEEILDRREQEEILDRGEQEEILDRGEQEEILDRGEQEEILDRGEQEEILDRGEQEEILDRGEQEEILDRGEQEEILDRGEQEEILDRGEQEEILDRGEQEEILDRREQEEILDRREQEEILDRREQEEILDRGEQEEILDRGEQEEMDRREQEEILDRGEQEEILDRGEQEEMDRREQEEILDRGEQEEILDRGEQEEILDRGEQEEIMDRGEQEEIIDRGEQEEILDRGEQEEILDRGEQEEMDRREQEEILDRGFGPYNDFKVSENNNKHEYGENHLKFDEGTIEELDPKNDPNPRLLCEGLSDKDRTLGRGQDICVSEAELELQIACDKRVFVSNDEITIVRDEQRMEINIERMDSTMVEGRENVSEGRSKVIEDRGSNKIEDVVISIGTKMDTEAEDVKDKVTGLKTFFYQERNVEVEKNQLEEEKISKEDEDPLKEVEGKLVPVVDAVENNNSLEIRGMAKYISLGLREEPVVTQEPKRVACEETREENPEINNGKENTAPEILEVGDDEVNTTFLHEVHTDRDTKELDSVENTGTSFKSDNSPVSELMEGNEDPKTVEGSFESEDIENASDTVEDEKAAKPLEETDQILEDLTKTKAESHEPMEIEVGLSEEAAETDVCLSDETLRTEAGLYKEKEEINAEFREGWMESKAGETVGTELESVKESQAEMPEVRAGVVPSEDTDETESGSMQDSEDTDLGLPRKTVVEGLEKGAEADTADVKTETVLSMETNTEELVESEAWDTLETESGLVKEHEAEIPDVRTETASSETMTLYPSSTHTEAVFLTETKAVLSNESLETDNGLSDKSSEARTKLQGMVEAGLPDSTEIEAELLEAMVGGEVVLSEEKTNIKATLMEELVESGAGETSKTEKGILNETDAAILDMRIEASPSEETESGIVNTEARFLGETTAIESELLEELSETESGSQKDKEVKRQRIETEPSVETDVEELVESEAGDTVETDVGLVKTVAELPEEVRPKIELLGKKPNRTDEQEEMDTDETEARSSEEIETDLIETKYGLQKNIEEDMLHVRTETVLSVESVETNTDSSDESLESRSLDISEAGLSEQSVDREAGLQEIYTEIPDVENESALSEETLDAGLSEKTDVPDTECVKNTEAGLMLEAELSDETEAGLKEKTEDNMPNKSLEIEVGLFGETDETEALVTEEVVKTGPGLSKPTDFGSQGQLLEIEVGIIEKSQVGCSEETVETDAGLPEENKGFSSPSGTKNVDQNLQLQFDTSALDFTAQKSRIALKNPHARPPRDPRTLLQMPSLTPSPSKPSVHVAVRDPTGILMRGMGGIGIKLPGLSAGFPILRKTEKGVRGEKSTENIPQKSEIKQDVRDESPKKEEMQESKKKWTPPRHPGFGNPQMMNELNNKLKKTTKGSGGD